MWFVFSFAFVCLFSFPVLADNWLKHVVADDVLTVREAYAFDIDADGDIDVASVAHDSNEVAWWENIEGSFEKHVLASDFWDAWSVTCADIDNDGDGDVLAAGYFADQVALWEYTPDGFIYQEVIHLNGAKGVHVADMNLDGRLDVIGAGAQADKISVAMNFGVDADERPDLRAIDIATNIDGVRSTYAADLNNDGRQDIIASAGASGTILWFQWDAGNWIEHTIIGEEYEGSRGVSAADIDNDGDMDVVGTAYIDDEIYWFENDGTPGGANWDSHDIGSPNGPISIVTADFDYDGDIDVLCGVYLADKIKLYTNDGTPDAGWSATNIATNVDGATDIFVVDLDFDGYLDVVAAGWTESSTRALRPSWLCSSPSKLRPFSW